MKKLVVFFNKAILELNYYSHTIVIQRLSYLVSSAVTVLQQQQQRQQQQQLQQVFVDVSSDTCSSSSLVA